jgi:magnesium chelatase subunit D
MHSSARASTLPAASSHAHACRIAITLSADVPMSFEQRVEAVAAAERFQNFPTQVLDESREEQDATAASILLGREMLPEVAITDDQVRCW